MIKLALPLVLSALACTACGNGSLVLIGDGGGDTQDTIKIQGNIRDTNPEVAGARIVVFVFTGLVRTPCSNDADCAHQPDHTCIDDVCQSHPNDFDSFEKQRSVAVESNADPLEFTVTQVRNGDVTIVFLQDDVSNPDGHIDEGDPHAVLKDPHDVLENVRNGETIRLTDVNIDFATDDSGTADAESLRSVSGVDDGQR